MDWSEGRPIRSQGFTLIEVVLALCVVSFGLVGILGLFPVGLNSVRESIQDTRSAHLSRSIAATLRGQPYKDVNLFGARLDLAEAAARHATVSLFADEQGTVQTTQNGLMIGQPDADTRYFITVRFWEGPSDLPEGTACTVLLEVSWDQNEAERANRANPNRAVFGTTISRF